jgi:hypothetical protein
MILKALSQGAATGVLAMTFAVAGDRYARAGDDLIRG